MNIIILYHKQMKYLNNNKINLFLINQKKKTCLIRKNHKNQKKKNIKI